MISIITPARIKDATGLQWLHEAIASVYDQDYQDWEHIVVDDRSPEDLGLVQKAWQHVRWLKATGQGVSEARNQAVEAAQGDLILPLDADDKLAPSALRQFAAAWTGKGIVYSDVVMFGQDYARVYLAPEYDFPKLLHATFMVVGCLHLKSDWERIGGWRSDMTGGLEDWEYWIRAGELGICGKRVAEPLYWYRRHPTGRLAWLKGNKELWSKAYNTMRELHRESYNGRYPMGCCGSGAKAAPRRGAPMSTPQQVNAALMDTIQKDGVVQMVYVGARAGGFSVISGVTRTHYDIPGPGQLVVLAHTTIPGVRPEDVAWFRSVGGGRDFQIMAVPKPAPPVAEVVAASVSSADSEAWTPATMESVPLPEAEVKSAKSKRTKGG